jgi:hypothetical protein
MGQVIRVQEIRGRESRGQETCGDQEPDRLDLSRLPNRRHMMRPPGQDTGILAEVANTDFLQAISLFHTRDRRRQAEMEGRQGKELPPVSSNRQSLLNLPLHAYKTYEAQVDRQKLTQWYWNGVFGELYGSTVAYKGVNALLMKEGAEDFRSGQKFGHTIFFGEAVDIHHIFPKQWCVNKGIGYEVHDSIINKTPLSYRTNRIIGGVAPTLYLKRLETGTADTPAIDSSRLDQILASHSHRAVASARRRLRRLDGRPPEETPRAHRDGDGQVRLYGRRRR